MNFKVLVGVSVAIIAVIAILLQENTMSEQEVRESIQNEISPSPQITGIHAQTICKILDMECSDQKLFYAVFDSIDGYTKFRHTTPNNVHYDFRIIDDVLEYKNDHNPTEWRIFGDGSWMWDDDK